MRKMVSKFLVFVIFVVAIFVLECSNGFVKAQKVPAMFVFGDSLVDVGNNNFLRSIARSNYFPYGIDYNNRPTGRFCNGKTFVDMIGDLLGVPYPSPFADPNTKGTKLLYGVNYASAAAGILDESGKHYGDRFSLSQQVVNFEHTLEQLQTMMDPKILKRDLGNSIAILVFGSNDYINNYLMPSIYSSSRIYTPLQFANLLLNNYARQLLRLYNLGLRKVFIAGIGPLGCIPNQRAKGEALLSRCVDDVNQMLGSFNEGLKSIVDQLNTRPGATFAYGNTYGVVGDILNNPGTYGFSVVDKGCCGIGRNEGEITCLPWQIPCRNRNEYVFWDAFHPTQAANLILAQHAFYGPPSHSYPINIQQMSLIH